MKNQITINKYFYYCLMFFFYFTLGFNLRDIYRSHFEKFKVSEVNSLYMDIGKNLYRKNLFSKEIITKKELDSLYEISKIKTIKNLEK